MLKFALKELLAEKKRTFLIMISFFITNLILFSMLFLFFNIEKNLFKEIHSYLGEFVILNTKSKNFDCENFISPPMVISDPIFFNLENFFQANNIDYLPLVIDFLIPVNYNINEGIPFFIGFPVQRIKIINGLHKNYRAGLMINELYKKKIRILYGDELNIGKKLKLVCPSFKTGRSQKFFITSIFRYKQLSNILNTSLINIENYKYLTNRTNLQYNLIFVKKNNANKKLIKFVKKNHEIVLLKSEKIFKKAFNMLNISKNILFFFIFLVLLSAFFSMLSLIISLNISLRGEFALLLAFGGKTKNIIFFFIIYILILILPGIFLTPIINFLIVILLRISNIDIQNSLLLSIFKVSTGGLSYRAFIFFPLFIIISILPACIFTIISMRNFSITSILSEDAK